MRSGRLLGAFGVVAMLSVATPVAARAAARGPVGPCAMFPSDSWWHADISQLPVDPASATYVASMGASKGMHADFGSGTWDGGPIGIPYVVVSAQPGVAVTFDYDDESDHPAGGYPIPPNAPIEGGPSSTGDRHLLVVDAGSCTLYELYDATPNGDGTWSAGSGAVWSLASNALRPAGWTSADAAGLPILPGLVRYDEVAAGHIDHAIRVTASATANRFVWPARHQAGSANGALPPMGERFRLKAGVDISRFPRDDQVILEAMKTYGLVVADNGSSWYISGAPDERWDNDVLHALGQIDGNDFEAVDMSSLQVSADSGQVAGGLVGGDVTSAPEPTDPATTAAPATGAPPSASAPPVPPSTTDAVPTTSTSTATTAAPPVAASARVPARATPHRPWWLIGFGLALIGGCLVALRRRALSVR